MEGCGWCVDMMRERWAASTQVLMCSDSLSRRNVLTPGKFRIRDEHMSLSLSTQFLRDDLSTTSASLRTTHETVTLRLTTSVTGRYGCDAINRAENERR